MPESSDPSMETIFSKNLISKAVAMGLLQELLDEGVKNRILEKFSQKLEESLSLKDKLKQLQHPFDRP